MGTAMACHPFQTSASSLASRLPAMIRVMSSRSRHLSFPAGQYLPFPYIPSMPAAIRVSSSLSFGSAGAASVRLTFKSVRLRARSGGSATPSKRAAFLASSAVAPISRALACAARISVSSVMNVACTHAARDASTDSASIFVSASSRNCFASATVGGLSLAGGSAVTASRLRAGKARATAHRRRARLMRLSLPFHGWRNFIGSRRGEGSAAPHEIDGGALEAVHQFAFHRRMEGPYPGPLLRGSGDDGVEALADPLLEQQRGGGLADLALDVIGVVFSLGALRGERLELLVGIGRGPAGERALQEALGHEIRKPAVGRRGMGVVL